MNVRDASISINIGDGGFIKIEKIGDVYLHKYEVVLRDVLYIYT